MKPNVLLFKIQLEPQYSLLFGSLFFLESQCDGFVLIKINFIYRGLHSLRGSLLLLRDLIYFPSFARSARYLPTCIVLTVFDCSFVLQVASDEVILHLVLCSIKYRDPNKMQKYLNGDCLHYQIVLISS